MGFRSGYFQIHTITPGAGATTPLQPLLEFGVNESLCNNRPLQVWNAFEGYDDSAGT